MIKQILELRALALECGGVEVRDVVRDDLDVELLGQHAGSGDIEGALELRGVNGKVELGQATTSIQISGVNGNIAVGMKQLGDGGARLSGVNGNIELRLSKDLNADLTARGMNGNLRSDIPEVNVEKEEHGSRYAARIGNGGAPITISGINGNVRLMRAESSATGPASSDQKSASTQKEGKSPTESKAR